ncbi:EAL domain-containing protein [Modestobacter sp. VKM Ac-2977]|uniref:EAL domain-containing protein n=1 Tax=Modestobacter sp. VKM Ac-2977 TaxID=3004131 RepID=UPI0022AAFBE0|nr:EAL domain-containing protein [Modestobacter sp. VKM Ac-2977]MCZ2819552.1 EAL domain-containing protein [Modestobacter sp. VKM Ac-2977]
MSSTATATAALADVALPDGALQVALSADLARTDAGGTLRELAQPVHRVPGGATMASVDALFRRDATLRWVVVDGPGDPVLVSRSWFELSMTGRLGYGRLLQQRRRVRDAAPPETLRYPADCPVARAAAAVIHRRSGGEDLLDGVLVSWPDGRLGVAPVTAVFEQLAQEYAHQALHDPLTGLPNRLFLLERLRQAVCPGSSAVLFVIDLDRFKDVNDHLGHAAGDDVLTEFAQRLRTVARSEDLVVRLSGDEFALLTTALTTAQSTALAERIVLTAAAPFVVLPRGAHRDAEQLASLGASVGVASCSMEVRSPDELLHRADLAMFRAKSLGRGRVAHFDTALLEDAETTDAVRARHRMERRLRLAIESRSLSLHYQPVVTLPSGQVTGVEALARWEDDELGRVAPDQFIPLAERTGLVVDLGRWVLQTACREAAGWPAGPSGVPPTVAVNVSPVQLAQRGFIDDVTRALADSGLAPDRLCLEITETAAITDLTATAARLSQVRDLGVRLALDDFGAGHSALTLLRALPVHLVKIDRSFIERVASDTADAVLVRLVIEAAHSLGRRVCAEGVETAEQAQQLVSMGCDSAQGWLFGRPEPASPRLAGLLTSRTLAEPLATDAVLPLGGNDELVLVTTPERVITYASASSGPILGWLPQELVGRSVTEFVHPDDLARARTDRELAARYSVGLGVHRVLHRDGGVRWLESDTRRLAADDGTVREVLSVSRDVTATVEARRDLADSELMFRHAFDDAPIGMTLTRMDGSLVRVNKAFAALLGTTTEALAARRVQDLTPADGQAAVGGLFTEFIGVTELSTRFRHADGTEVPVLVRVSVVRDQAGEPTSVFSHVLPGQRPAPATVPAA